MTVPPYIKMLLSLIVGFGLVLGSGSAAGAVADTAAPVLSEVDFTPKTVDVSTGAKNVVVTARVTDATGTEAPTMLIGSDSTSQTAGFGSMTLASGTTQDGVWQRTVSIPATAAPGSWTVTIYPLSDTVGNSETGFHNHPTKLNVTNGPADTAAPDAPSGVSAKPGDGFAQVTWSAADDNSSPITGYTVTAIPGGRSVTVSGDLTSVIIDGLRNGSAYTFTVQATNVVGTSPASAPSAAVTPATKPGRVVKPTAKVIGRKAIVKWTRPTDGGSALTGYRVSINGKARTTDADVRKLVFTRLKPGRYKVKVRAVNAVGVGSASETVRFRIRSS